MNTTGERQHAHSPEMVEMAGVEPASRRFVQGHTTSLVDLLVLARVAADQQAATQASRYRAHSLPASDPTYRRLWECTPGLLSPTDLYPRGRERVDVTVKRSGYNTAAYAASAIAG